MVRVRRRDRGRYLALRNVVHAPRPHAAAGPAARAAHRPEIPGADPRRDHGRPGHHHARPAPRHGHRRPGRPDRPASANPAPRRA
ncbi:hypothetical protein G6F57_023132 [Rhizopus arrhizus]|nr:hypothetical protein G6F57_023132 [Rhizopus arrhizus]